MKRYCQIWLRLAGFAVATTLAITFGFHMAVRAFNLLVGLGLPADVVAIVTLAIAVISVMAGWWWSVTENPYQRGD